MDPEKVVFEGRECWICPNCFSQQHHSDNCPYMGQKKPAMKVIKTFDPERKTVTLRTDINANDFAHFRLLADEAKYDFPGLKDSEILIEKYPGIHYTGTYVIEFIRSNAPSNYEIAN